MHTMMLLRGTVLLTVAKALVLVFLLFTVYTVAGFSRSTRAAIDRSFSSGAAVDMYGLTDRISDPTTFQEYRESSSNIDKVTDFYDTIHRQSPAGVQLLSAFNQPMPIAQFRGDETFEYGFGTTMAVQGTQFDPVLQQQTRNVKAMQLNKETFEFYHLSDSATPGFTWSTVDYSSGSIPVMLGAHYRQTYAIGDQLLADYYGVAMRFTVTAFLPTHASMFYQETMDWFLDDTIVIPYPDSIHAQTTLDASFRGILAFAMLNADIAVNRTLPSNTVPNLLQTAAITSGFDQYALLNVPTYLTQFAGIRALIADNFTVISAVTAIIGAAALTMAAFLTNACKRRRQRRVRLLWQLGHPRRGVQRALTMLATGEYATAAALFAGTTLLLPNDDTAARIGCLIFIAGLFSAEHLIRRAGFRAAIRHQPGSET